MSALLDDLAKLNDPAVYTKRAGIPVFDEHTSEVDGEQKEVTLADLHEIAAVGQAMERNVGVAGILRGGHIRHDEADETQQPPTVGAFKNMRVGSHPVSGKTVILVDEYALNEHAEKGRNLPYRSVEYFRPQKMIGAVAWLSRQPRRPHLGVNLFAAPGRPELHSMEAAMADETTTTPAATATAPPELEAAIMAVLQKLGLVPAAGAAPAPTAAPATFAATPAPELYALQTELAVLKAKDRTQEEAIKQLRDKAADAEVRSILKDLVAEHYSFDAAAEIAVMVPMSEADRVKRANYIRQHHAKVPGSDLIELYGGQVEPGAIGAEGEMALHKKAMKILTATPGMTYEAAVKSASEK